MNNRPFQLGAIIGPARSGTTWVGAMVDSSPDVIYRFEPFHRLAAVSVEAREWMERLKFQRVGDTDVAAIYSLLCPAHPLTNKAPFFDDKSYRLRTFGRRQMWPMARLAGPVRAWYRAAYSPEPGPPLIFKEVTFVRQLRNFAEKTAVPFVYLVRHPCATVLSSMSASAGDSIASTHLRLREILGRNAPAMIDRYKAIIESDDVVSQRAVMWLYEVESCVATARASTHGMVLTYEQLAEDAYSHGERLFQHLGLGFGDATRHFIDRLYGLDSDGKVTPQRTGWGAKYYTVYRNPRALKDFWRSKMSVVDQGKVEAVVRGSPAVEYCSSLGGWW